MASYHFDDEENEFSYEKILMIIMLKKKQMNYPMNVKLCTKQCQLKSNKSHLLKKRLTRMSKLNHVQSTSPLKFMFSNPILAHFVKCDNTKLLGM